jgi:multicomponent Na+:H+ antiporter subunit B
MLRRIFIFIILLMTAWVFADIALNFTERTQLTGVSKYYVENTAKELGAANIVTAVVVTYRGLDTLGEVTVLFIAAAGIGLMLSRRKQDQHVKQRVIASEVVQTATQIILPMILLFGVYIFLNGHLTPGGGFQGGAVIASGAMLLLITLPDQPFNNQLLHRVESLSGFFYVMIGVLGILLAGGFLDNRIMALGTFGSLFSAGAIPLIYLLIGLKVGAELSTVLQRFRW